jgi:hypothetical protein
MAGQRYSIEGMPELERYMRDMGKLPQKCVTKSARQGANIPLKSARTNAPVDTGALKRGLKLKGELTKTKGKKVYQVTFDKAMNDTFVKISRGGKRAYYPASQEYGFQTKNGGYIPGYHYLEKSVTSNVRVIQKRIVGVLLTELRKLR